jgi:hypothetical protein
MKRIVVGVIVLIALAATGLWWFQTRSMPIFFAQDAVQVLAYAASDMFQSNPSTTQDEIDRMIKSQHEASNINLRIDPNGKAVDPFGTAFLVEHQVQSGKSNTTVTSAGPDCEFGTEDDISFEHERESEPQQGARGDGVNRAP